MAQIVERQTRKTNYFLRLPDVDGGAYDVNLKSFTAEDAAKAAEKHLSSMGSVDNVFKRYVKQLLDDGALSIWRVNIVWKHVAELFKFRLAASITLEDVKTYIKFRRDGGHSDQTIFRVELAYVISAFKLAGLMLPMPRDRVEPNVREIVLPMKTINSIFKNCAGWFLTFMVLAVHTGGRNAAILRLKWKQVDWLTGTLALQVRNDGSPRRKHAATVKMSKPLLAYLKSLGQHDPEAYVVNDNGKPITGEQVKWRVKLLRRAVACQTVSPHVIRHSIASHMLMKKVGVKEVSVFLGHKNVRITERVYAKFLPKRMAESAKFLDQIAIGA